MLRCYHAAMARVTLTLPDELHRALKEAAATRGRTIGELVAESVRFYGIQPREEAAAIVARARQRSGLSERAALRLAIAETRSARRR